MLRWIFLCLFLWGCAPTPPPASPALAFQHALLDGNRKPKPDSPSQRLCLWAEPQEQSLTVVWAVFKEGRLLPQAPPQLVEARPGSPARLEIPSLAAQPGARLFVAFVHPQSGELGQLQAAVSAHQEREAALYDLLTRWHGQSQSLAHGGEAQIEVGAVRVGPAASSNEIDIEHAKGGTGRQPVAQAPPSVEPKFDWKSLAEKGECSPTMQPVRIIEFR